MAIRVDLDIGKGSGVEQGIDRLIDALDRLQARLDGIKGDLGGIGKAAAASGSGFQKAASGVAQTGQQARQALGPMQRLIKAQEQLDAAKASGDPARIFDAQFALTRAQNALARAKGVKKPGAPPPTPQEILQQALLRTRFSASGAGFPLGVDIQRILRSGGNVAALFGSGSKSGASGGAGAAGGGAAMGAIARLAPIVMKLAGPVALAAVAATALWKAANSAAASLRDLAQTRAATGGTVGEVTALERLGRSLGIENVKGSVQSFSEQIRSGIGAGAAASIGINPNRGPFGDTNDARAMIRAIERLASFESDEEAKRFAKMIPALQEFLPIRDLSASSRRQMLGDMARSAKGDNRTSLMAGAEFNLTLSRFFNAWDGFKRAIMPFVSVALLNFTTLIKGLTAQLEVINKFLEMFAGWLLQIAARIAEWLGLDVKSAQIQQDHTREMQNHARAMKDHRETLGGGARARGAVPSGLKGWQLADDEIRRQGLRLGVY